MPTDAHSASLAAFHPMSAVCRDRTDPSSRKGNGGVRYALVAPIKAQTCGLIVVAQFVAHI